MSHRQQEEEQVDDVPGPGHYDVQGKMKPNARKAPSHSMGIRYWKDKQTNFNPGPQHYDIADGKKSGSILSTKSSCQNMLFGKSKRWPKPMGASDVGPGKYKSHKSTFGNQISSTLDSAPRVKFGTGPQRVIGKLDDCSVDYIAAPSYIGKGKKMSMRFREKFGSTTFTKGNNPGPGAYNPKDQPGRAGTAKVRGFGFGTASRLPKVKHQDFPGPGQYGAPNKARRLQNRTWTNMRLRAGLRSRK